MKRIDKTVDAFKAIGDSTRFRILQLLSNNGQLCVNALADRLKIAQPTVSQHLKILKNAGIVQAKRIGNHIHYSIKANTLETLNNQIVEFLKEPVEMCTDEPSNINCKHK